jgi:isopentenyl-diphosphate delta-isomerase
MDTKRFEARKREHIQHSLNSAHQAKGLSGLDEIDLWHDALPELDLQEVSLNTPCLGRSLPTPFYIAGMTAGHEHAFEMNRMLAHACQQRGWAMGVGSQRRDLESRHSEGLDQWKRLRDEVPRLTLFANLGISQLIHTSLDEVKRVVEEIDAQALVVHTNALQEALQPEGTPQFQSGISTLQALCRELGRPVVLKETGCGFAAHTLKKLSSLGLAALDVSGLGGTHWGRIEGARADEGSVQAAAAQTFANWGISTVDSVRAAAQCLPSSVEVWASGGVRSGLDAAKLLALGAHRVGYAKPALEAVMKGAQALNFWMELQEFELKVALFCTGSQSGQELKLRSDVLRMKV